MLDQQHFRSNLAYSSLTKLNLSSDSIDFRCVGTRVKQRVAYPLIAAVRDNPMWLQQLQYTQAQEQLERTIYSAPVSSMQRENLRIFIVAQIAAVRMGVSLYYLSAFQM